MHAVLMVNTRCHHFMASSVEGSETCDLSRAVTSINTIFFLILTNIHSQVQNALLVLSHINPAKAAYVDAVPMLAAR